MKRKSLFLVYVNLKPSRLCDYIVYTPIYCYAFSHCHATQLAIRYCVDHLFWELDSFDMSDPLLLDNFAR